MKCDVCGKSVEIGPMYRVSPLGDAGVFRHQECGGAPVDEELARLCNLIHGDGKKTEPAEIRINTNGCTVKPTGDLILAIHDAGQKIAAAYRSKPTETDRVPATHGIPPDVRLATTLLRDATEDEAGRQGYWASTFGLTGKSNPYPSTDTEGPHEWWADGWTDAEADDPTQPASRFA